MSLTTLDESAVGPSRGSDSGRRRRVRPPRPSGNDPPLTPEQARAAALLRAEPAAGNSHHGWIEVHGYRGPADDHGRLPATAAELAAICRATADGMPFIFEALNASPAGRRAFADEALLRNDVRRLYRMAGAFGRAGNRPPDPPPWDGPGSAPVALARMAEWCDSVKANRCGQATDGKQAGRGKNIDAKLFKLYSSNPDSLNWSALALADHLNCSDGTIKDTSAWKDCQKLRKKMQVEAVQRAKRPDRETR